MVSLFINLTTFERHHYLLKDNRMLLAPAGLVITRFRFFPQGTVTQIAVT